MGQLDRGWRRHAFQCLRFGDELAGAWQSAQPIHAKEGSILQIVKPPTRPGPVPGRANQSAFDRMVVQVVQFLLNFLFAEDVKRGGRNGSWR